MKNYYEILEINEKASQEMVEKAYKVLVKRYHPDLQETQEAKVKCEEKIKQINEAYDVISVPNLRADYDAKLKAEYNRRLQQEIEEQKKAQLRQQEQYYNANNNQQQNMNKNIQDDVSAEYKRQYKETIDKEYQDAYVQDRNKFNKKKTLNDYIRSLIALLITIGVVLVVLAILQLPFVKL